MNLHYLTTLSLILLISFEARASEFNSVCKGKTAGGLNDAVKIGAGKAGTFDPRAEGRETYQQPLGARKNSLSKFRWRSAADGKIYIEREDVGKDFYAPPIPSGSCRSVTFEDLELVTCADLLHLLYSKKQLLFVAIEDYGPPKIEVLEKAKLNESAHFLVKTFEKGTAQYFDLVSSKGKWSATVCKEESKPVD